MPRVRIVLTLFVVSSEVVFGAAAQQTLSKDTAPRPNVVMILADDQSYRDFGFMGNDIVHTPHLDWLASQSARFPNGYVPIASAARRWQRCSPGCTRISMAFISIILHLA